MASCISVDLHIHVYQPNLCIVVTEWGSHLLITAI